MAKLKHMFKKTAVLFRDREDRNQEKKEPSAPEGLWLKCPKCGEVVYRDDVKAHGYVCPKCEGYFRIGTRTRIRMVADTGTFQEWFTDLETENPLEYPGYEEKIADLQEKTKLHEAVTVGKCMVNGLETVLGVCDARFLMGSMGYVVGEKITRAFERATEEKLPVVLFTSSGGARMQEGIVSLMQMAKTSAAIRKHSEAGTDRSDHRRGDGKFCDAWRCDPGRTGGTDRICRTESDRADHRTETAGGISESRIPGGKRNHRWCG